MKSQLWDMGLDWCEVEDFELFMMLVQTLTPDRTSILFGDLDFSKLELILFRFFLFIIISI